ncbi:MAG TPA: acyltransferase [Thermoleophilaceae bacterium]
MTTVPAPPVPRVPVRGRLPGIEGLRAIAAIAVLVHHTWILDGGQRVGADSGAGAIFLNLALGVTLFFALSGFLLYRPFAAAILRGRDLPSIRRYLRNRALRILPAYWAILLLTSFVLQTATTRDAGGALQSGAMTNPGDLLRAALLVQDYDPQTVIIGIGPAWSLAVEVVFYLLLPLLVLAVAAPAARAAGRGRRVLILMAPPLLLLLIGLSGKVAAGVLVPGSPAAGYESDWHSVIERSFWAQADLFSFGMVAAVLHTEVADGRLALHRHWRAGALALAALIFVPCAISLNSGQLSYQPQNTAVALAAALFLAAVAFPGGEARGPWLQRLLEWRFIVTAGLISYSVFLWNEPVLRWLTAHGATTGGWVGLALNLALAAAVVGALSLLSYRFVELPWLRRKGAPAARDTVDAAQLEAAP